jgi:hypothetical protein
MVKLSKREEKIMTGIAGVWTNAKIARKFGIIEAAVTDGMWSMYRKFYPLEAERVLRQAERQTRPARVRDVLEVREVRG